MASNFELGDEQPENPTPRRKPFKASGNNNKIIHFCYESSCDSVVPVCGGNNKAKNCEKS